MKNETFPKKCPICLILGKETIWRSTKERIEHSRLVHQIKRSGRRAGAKGAPTPNFRNYAVKQ